MNLDALKLLRLIAHPDPEPFLVPRAYRDDVLPLCDAGYVEMKPGRSSWEFRVTHAGKSFLAGVDFVTGCM